MSIATTDRHESQFFVGREHEKSGHFYWSFKVDERLML